jgi:hypothetical protein
MDCITVGQLIGPMADAQLPQELTDAVTIHCLSCPRCSQELHTQTTIRTLVQSNLIDQSLVVTDSYRSRCMRRLTDRFPHCHGTTPMSTNQTQYQLPIQLEDS